MKIVASIIKVTDRIDFYIWLESLPWSFTEEEKKKLAEQAKYCDHALWTRKEGFRFW